MYYIYGSVQAIPTYKVYPEEVGSAVSYIMCAILRSRTFGIIGMSHVLPVTIHLIRY